MLTGVVTAGLHAASHAGALTALGTAFGSAMGGIITLSASSFERTPTGLRVSAKEFESLIELHAEVAGIERKVERHAVIPITDDAARKMLERVGEVEKELTRMALF